MKTFNVGVALVEPGVINTDMAQRIASSPKDLVYQQPARLAVMFTSALKNPAAVPA